MLRIYLLGPFRVEQNGRALTPEAWARPRDRALLKILALQPGHVVPQDRLLDALWPDLPPSAAANSLHVAVSRLRKLLGLAPLIRRAGAGYTLAPADSIQVWIDVEEFRRLLGQGRDWRRRGAWAPAAQAYRAAAALYRGDLCEDDPYAEWVLQPREHLRETFLALLEELADCLVHVGAAAEATDVCERGLAQDRTREGLYVQLMRAHGAAGHLAEALQVYERCRRALAEELGVDPGPAARALHAQLLREDELGIASPSRAPTAAGAEPGGLVSQSTHVDVARLHLPCVGRERELADLASRLDVAQAGHGQLILLHGEPGIGKSRLLEELGWLAESRGIRRLDARCYELERDLPYAPIVDALGSLLVERTDAAEVASALGQWAPQLAGLIPALRDLVPDLPRHQPLRPDAERSALLAGLTHLLVSLSRRQALALLVDDLQWADASTVQWLHYLARRLGGLPVLIVGTYRTGEVPADHPLRPLVEHLGSDPMAPRLIELACLGVEDVAALLPSVAEVAARLHRETDGHPLFLVETLRTLLETGVLRLDDRGVWAEPGVTLPAPERRLPLPPNLREAIRWRLRRLNERERRVLMAAAVAERGFRSELLAPMAELPSEAVLDALALLWRDPVPGRRQGDGLSSNRRSGPCCGCRCRANGQSRETEDAKAVLDALVGRQLLRLSPAGSGFDFRHDLIGEVVYADLTPDRRRTLHARAADALQARVDEQRMPVGEIAGELAHHWRQAERWALALRYALLAGDHARESFAPREALAHYQRAAEIAASQPALLEPADHLGLVERLGRAYAEVGELDAALGHFERLRELARALDDRLLEGRALAALADARYWRHDFGQAEALAAEALKRAEALGNRGLRAGSLVTAASVALARGRIEDAEQRCGAVLALAGDRPPPEGGEEPVLAGARLNALGWLGLLREFQGDHERAMPAIEASLGSGASSTTRS